MTLELPRTPGQPDSKDSGVVLCATSERAPCLVSGSSSNFTSSCNSPTGSTLSRNSTSRRSKRSVLNATQYTSANSETGCCEVFLSARSHARCKNAPRHAQWESRGFEASCVVFTCAWCLQDEMSARIQYALLYLAFIAAAFVLK